MKKNLKKIIVVVLICSIIFNVGYGMVNAINIQTEDIDDLSIITTILPQETLNYINEKTPLIVNDMIQKADMFGFEGELSEVFIGSPITVFIQHDGEIDDEVLCFVPVFEGDQVIQSLVILGNVLDEEAELGIQTTTDMVYDLNWLLDHRNSLGTCYLVGMDGTLNVLNKEKDIIVSAHNQNQLLAENFDKSAENIIDDIEDQFQNSLTEVDSQEMISEMVTYDTETSTLTPAATTSRLLFGSGDVYLYGVTQSEDGYCWAAAVATIVRYKKKNLSATDMSVWAKTGLPIGSTGGEDNVIPCLESYGIRKYKYVSVWLASNARDSIDYGYPAILKVTPKLFQNTDIKMHMVDVVGYNTATGTYYMWDPKGSGSNGSGSFVICNSSSEYYSPGYDLSCKWSKVACYVFDYYK